MMKNSRTLRMIFILILILAVTPIYAKVSADDGAREGTVQAAQQARLTFSDLGMAAPEPLSGPVSQHVIRFNLPVDWTVSSDSIQLSLELSAYFSSMMPAEGQEDFMGLTGGDLIVSLNGMTILQTTLQDSGDQTVGAEFPAQWLRPVTRDGSNELVIRWDGSASCRMNLLSSITVLPASTLSFDYELEERAFSLNDFPAPFVLDAPVEPAELVLLVPVDASLPELRALLIGAAGFGRLSSGKQPVRMETLEAYRMSAQVYENVVVFAAENHLDDAALRSLGYEGGWEIREGEGGLHIFGLRNGGSGLLVSGNETGIVTAAQVLSTGALAASGDLFSVTASAVNTVPPLTGRENLSLLELGAGELVFSVEEGLQHSFDFFIPALEQARADSAFNMVLNHSQQLDYLRSGLEVKLNGFPMASVRLNDQTSNEALFQLVLPATLIRPGRNTVEMTTNLAVRDICGDPAQAGAWLRVSGGSVLHLPLESAPLGALAPKSFDAFPDVFLSGQGLDNVQILLSAEDPAGWPAAVQVSFELGSGLPDSSPVALQVSDGSMSDGDQLGNNNVIMVGKPQDFPGLTGEDLFPTLNFDDQGLLTDRSQIEIVLMPVGSAGMGYTAVRGYPGQAHRVVLAVLGTSADGLASALGPLKDSASRDHNFSLSVSESEHVSWYDEAVASGRIEAQQGNEVQIVEGSDAALEFRQGLMSWALPALGGILFIIAMLAVSELRRSARKR